MLALDEAPRLEALRGMVPSEYALGEDQLRPLTLSRLEAWLQIAEDDLDQARTLAAGYDRVFDELPADMAMRRASMIQTAARGLPPAQLERLFDVVPSLARQIRRAKVMAAPPPREVREALTSPPSRRWWQFWIRPARAQCCFSGRDGHGGRGESARPPRARDASARGYYAWVDMG